MDSKTESRKKTSSINSEKRLTTDNITQTKIVKKFFVHPVNSIYGHSFCETLKGSMGGNCTIIGTLDGSDDSDYPVGIVKLIQSSKPKEIIGALADCDVVSFEILKTETSLLEEVISFFEKNVFGTSKDLILISHPLIWYDTTLQQMTDLDSSDIMNDEDVNNDETKRTIKKKFSSDVPAITDKDFFIRRTLPCYEICRLLENRFYLLKDVNPNVYPKIVLPGIMYGRGEDDLYFLFEKLLEDSPAYVISGNGQNVIPFVHVMTLAEKVVLLVTLDHKEQRFFIYNQSETVNQRSLVQMFADFSGGDRISENGKIENLVDDNYELMTINLKFENSTIFEMKLNSMSSHSFSKLNSANQQNSVCRSIKSDFQNSLLEFLRYRNISFKRFVIIGHDKLFEDEQLANQFVNLWQCKVIRINSVIKDILAGTRLIPNSGKLAEEIFVAVQTEKDKINAEFVDGLNKKKLKKNANEIDEINLDYASIIPKELLLRLLKGVIVLDDFRFKNYALLQLPRRIELLEEFHSMLAENELHNNLHYVVFNFNMDAVAKKISDQETLVKANPKTEAYKEELENLKLLNETYVSSSQRLNSSKIKMSHVEFISTKINAEHIAECIKKDIPEFRAESEGKRVSTKPDLEFIEQTIVINNGGTKILNLTPESRKDRNEVSDFPPENKEVEIIKDEESVLNFKCLAIKQYLNDNVLPELTEAIVEICKNKPDDPVQYLIQFLRQKQIPV